MLWQHEFTAAEDSADRSQSRLCAPTPVTDGQRVYAFFDAPGLVALDMDGKVLWTLPLGPFKARIIWQFPDPVQGSVIICCDHSGDSFIMAFDKATGERCAGARRASRISNSPRRCSLAWQGKSSSSSMPKR